MSKYAAATALALLLATPAYAVDLGADVSSDVSVTTPDLLPDVSAESHVSTSTHSSSSETAPDGSATTHIEKSSTTSRDHQTMIKGDADMTVDDEE